MCICGDFHQRRQHTLRYLHVIGMEENRVIIPLSHVGDDWPAGILKEPVKAMHHTQSRHANIKNGTSGNVLDSHSYNLSLQSIQTTA